MIIKHGRNIHEVRKGLWAFFLDCALQVLIGWACYAVRLSLLWKWGDFQELTFPVRHQSNSRRSLPPTGHRLGVDRPNGQRDRLDYVTMVKSTTTTTTTTNNKEDDDSNNDNNDSSNNNNTVTSTAATTTVTATATTNSKNNNSNNDSNSNSNNDNNRQFPSCHSPLFQSES